MAYGVVMSDFRTLIRNMIRDSARMRNVGHVRNKGRRLVVVKIVVLHGLMIFMVEVSLSFGGVINYRQKKGEGAAFTRLHSQMYFTAQHMGNLSTDGQTQTGAAVHADGWAIHFVEKP